MPDSRLKEARGRSSLGRFLSFLSEAGRTTGLPLRAILIVVLALHVWVTSVAVNPVRPDEHFQILEFAWARAGFAPAAQLPWEWKAHVRPALQPTVALVVLRVLRTAGIRSPWVWIGVLRIGTLLLALILSLSMIAHVAPSLDRRGQRTLWLTQFGLWTGPLYLARYTSENLGGISLVAAAILLESSSGTSETVRARRRDVLAAVFLGLAFEFRFQMLLAIVPLLLWVAVQRNAQTRARDVRRAIRVSIWATAVVIAATALDCWFYHSIVFTPWNYFRVNLLDGVAARFGTAPWYSYLIGAPLWMVPPLGLALVGLAVVGLVRSPRSPWTWMTIAFVGGQSMIAHKEMRFLLPFIYVLPILVARGVASVPRSLHWRRVTQVLMIQNALLIILVESPALHRGNAFDAHYYRWLWNVAEEQAGQTVYVLDESGDPYSFAELAPNVYRHAQIRGVLFHSGERLPAVVPESTPPRRLLILGRSNTTPMVKGAVLEEEVYAAQPGYRELAGYFGQADAPWIPWLSQHDGWTASSSARRLWSVRVITSNGAEVTREQ